MIDRQNHLAHDLTAMKANYRSLLKERFKPLLEDARDAVLIEEPAVAIRRIETLLRLIETAFPE